MKLSSKPVLSVLVVALAIGCGDSSGTGSGGAASTTSATATAAHTATGVGVTTSTGSPFVCGMGGAGDEVECMTTNFDPMCGPCLAQACCTTTMQADGNAADDDVIKCAHACCLMQCYPGGASDYPLECAPPATAPSNGACVTLGGTVACNPITNEGCDAAAGESCDRQVDTSDGANAGANIGFKCYPALNGMGEMQNIHTVCQSCNDGLGYCKPGLSCFDQCAKFCCSDSDCSPGTCQHTDLMSGTLFPFAAGVGICTM